MKKQKQTIKPDGEEVIYTKISFISGYVIIIHEKIVYVIGFNLLSETLLKITQKTIAEAIKKSTAKKSIKNGPK